MTPRNAATGNRAPEHIAPEDIHPVPDEDGPHDVPDETVIEATLPTVPVADPD